MFTYMGMPVIVTPYLDDMPRMQLTPKVAENLPPAFAAEINAWMREFFGTESRAVVMADGIALGPKSIAALRTASQPHGGKERG